MQTLGAFIANRPDSVCCTVHAAAYSTRVTYGVVARPMFTLFLLYIKLFANMRYLVPVRLPSNCLSPKSGYETILVVVHMS